MTALDENATGWFEASVDLTESESVLAYLKMLGVNETQSPETLLNYVPRLALKLNRERAAGPLGEQALGGCVGALSRRRRRGARTER